MSLRVSRERSDSGCIEKSTLRQSKTLVLYFDIPKLRDSQAHITRCDKLSIDSPKADTQYDKLKTYNNILYINKLPQQTITCESSD